MRDQVAIPDWLAIALGLNARDRAGVVTRLAEIGGFSEPTRAEAADFLVEVLEKAATQIPPVPAAWSWAEWHNAGLQPLYDITREQDWVRMAICAIDLGLGDRTPRMREGSVLSPRGGLMQNLCDA